MRIRPTTLLVALALFPFGASVRAEERGSFSTPVFSLADSRAIYGKSRFPEPLLAPEMDVESELRFDWLHSEKRAIRTDEVKAEVEWSFGFLTLEVGTAYEREEERGRDPITRRKTRDVAEGMGSVELAARYPLYQFVCAD